MDPLSAGLLQGVLSLGGGILGGIFSSGDKDRALQAALEAAQVIDNLGLPPDQSIPLLLEEFKNIGIYSPELEQEIVQKASQVSQIQEDPRMRDASVQALQGIMQRGKVGLTPTERAELNAIRSSTAQEAEGRRLNILQSLAQRGMGSSGAEIMSALASGQQADQRQSEESDRQMAMASQNALSALAQSAGLANQIRGTDFNVAQTRAAAEDEMNRFNIQNAIAQQQRNIANLNQGQMYNLQNQQNIANQNVQLNNQELQRQAQAKQQNWQNQVNLAGLKSNALSNKSQVYGNQANQTANMWQNIGSGLASGVGAYNQYNQQNKQLDILKNTQQQNANYQKDYLDWLKTRKP